jgi:hypothetical protein
LFVKLPNSYFKKWTNFPEHPADWRGSKSKIEEAASKYNINYFPSSELSLNDLLHPYDLEPLNQEFVQRFESNLPRSLKVIKLAELTYPDDIRHSFLIKPKRRSRHEKTTALHRGVSI